MVGWPSKEFNEEVAAFVILKGDATPAQLLLDFFQFVQGLAEQRIQHLGVFQLHGLLLEVAIEAALEVALDGAPKEDWRRWTGMKLMHVIDDMFYLGTP
mgnify:CR=1 FL=1